MTPATIMTMIKDTQKIMQTAPAIVHAANHVVQNGIKTGGYEVLSAAWKGIAQNSNNLTNAKAISGAALKGIQKSFKGSGQLTTEVAALGRNVKSRFVAPKPKAIPQKPSASTALRNTTETANHGITESATGFSSMLGSVGSAAAKGGIAGIAIGITMETFVSYKRWKSGEISKEEYLSEIAKSGGQMGITGAATAGIMTAVSVPLAAAGLATAPITVPVSIVLGAGIDKIVAPAFGRGEYKKILDEAKYYQNLIYAHDDLVHAIEMTENQFSAFIDEYAQQMQVHAQLADTNQQMKQLHATANHQIQRQFQQTNQTFGSLGDLFNKI